MNFTWGKPRIRVAGLAVFVSLLILSCKPEALPPTIKPEIRIDTESVRMGTPVEVQYVFSTLPAFHELQLNLIVFVRFLDSSGTVRFLDDHYPPVRTNQWVPSQAYSYERTVLIPENIPAGDYTIELGLYSPEGKGERIEMVGEHITSRSYRVGKLRIEPAPDESGVEYVRGWHAPEREPGNEWYHWRWTTREAVVRFENPKADAVLYFRADTDLSKFSEPPTVVLKIGDRVVEEFPLDKSHSGLQRFPIERTVLGEDAYVELQILVSKTFTPAADGKSGDTRELGAKVLLIHLGKA